MARIRIDIDKETHQRLLRSAMSELRSIDAQAVILLRRALGLQIPLPELTWPAVDADDVAALAGKGRDDAAS
jgi:hypothetical protein